MLLCLEGPLDRFVVTLGSILEPFCCYFELLFCVDRADAEKLLSQWAEHSSVQLSSIGRIVSSGEDGGASPTLQGPRIFLQREADGSLESVRPSGWRHFDDEG